MPELLDSVQVHALRENAFRRPGFFNILICVLKIKQSLTGLEQHEGEQMIILLTQVWMY